MQLLTTYNSNLRLDFHHLLNDLTSIQRAEFWLAVVLITNGPQASAKLKVWTALPGLHSRCGAELEILPNRHERNLHETKRSCRAQLLKHSLHVMKVPQGYMLH